MEIVNPPGWRRPKGYSNGVAARGRQVFVAGQVGWTPDEVFEAADFVGQARQAFRNIAAILAAAGAAPEHVTRLTWFVTDKAEYLGAAEALGAAYREVFGRHFPAMSVVVVAGLVEDGAKLEIEATAVVPD